MQVFFQCSICLYPAWRCWDNNFFRCQFMFERLLLPGCFRLSSYLSSKSAFFKFQLNPISHVPRFFLCRHGSAFPILNCGQEETFRDFGVEDCPNEARPSFVFRVTICRSRRRCIDRRWRVSAWTMKTNPRPVDQLPLEQA